MLVLSRQRDETIMIGDEVEVTIVDIRGDKVRLGISAPRHVAVHRKEVYEAIKRENRAAAEVRPEDLPTAPGASGKGTGGAGNASGLKGGPLRPTVRATLQPAARQGRGSRRGSGGDQGAKQGGPKESPGQTAPSTNARSPEAKPMPADEPPPVPPPSPDESA